MPEPGTPESAIVRRLLEGPASETELDRLLEHAGTAGRARWLWWMGRAHRRCLFGYRLHDDRGELLAELIPTQPTAPEILQESRAVLRKDADVRVQLSRFAFLHRDRERLVLESPLASMRAEVGTAAAAAVASCAAPMSVGLLLDSPSGGDAIGMLVAALLEAGLLGHVDGDGVLDEDRDGPLVQWELHDLLLHTRSRADRAGALRGATFRFAGASAAPPALRESRSGTRIQLPRPDLAALRAGDVPLTRAMEDRTSRRTLEAPTVAQLGELMFRTMRVRGSRPASTDPRDYETTSRPYPSAGGMYELTAYLAVRACEGIERGLYRYDPVAHELTAVACDAKDLDRLLVDAGKAAVLQSEPPVAVVLAADFRRLSWKYEGIAYSLLLKNVGVVLGSMQLVATSMGMGCCPLGGGDAELLAHAIGSNPLEEASVGELILGA
ncbi:SagB family peptide dehydrogenase [Humibacter antri]